MGTKGVKTNMSGGSAHTGSKNGAKETDRSILRILMYKTARRGGRGEGHQPKGMNAGSIPSKTQNKEVWKVEVGRKYLMRKQSSNLTKTADA